MSSSKRVLELTLNLRDAYEAAKWRRVKRAINLLKERVKRITKVERVKLSEEVNKYMWSRSVEKPPRHISVVIEVEDEEAIVKLKGEEASSE